MEKSYRKLRIEELNRLSIDDFKKSRKTPMVIVLDNIRSLNNIGAFFRTADAFKIEAIYLCGITATPPHTEIHKTALGAEDSVKWYYFDSCVEALDTLADEKTEMWAVEQTENSTLLNDFSVDTSKRYVLVMGNEVKGVQQSVIGRCDGTIEIPQLGTKHSLNVSVTGGIVMWHFAVKHLSQ